ncbi:MAG: hypothetical protein EOO85_21255 [Pedobacter sp.]|nr:MAG: hypothetical protein EOO85_21255 [Pedobacter sp.]
MQRHAVEKEIQNIYALTVKDEEIYIEGAASGKKGYFCLGCKREMQAVKSQIIGRQSYFRHDVEANKNQGKCTYSDETYRHKLGKEQLQLTKRIKVPPIYKFQADGSGQAMFVSPSKFIEAHRVANELQFYEDDDGIIRWGRDIGEGKNLLIRPDVTFFDSQDKPILLIEIVATHKLTTEKLTKILRLGIDTVSVTIPKDSPENIAETFNQITRTQWIFSNEQQSADYISVTDGHPEDVLSISEEQRRNFKLTFRCRQAEIRSLISRIRRCLGSEHYREIDERNQRELSRVQGNTEELLRDIDREEASYRQSVDEPETIEIRENTKSRRANQAIIDEYTRKYRDLEGRYTAKAEKLKGEEEEIDGQLQRSIESLGRAGKECEARRRAIKFEKRRVDESYINGTKNIEGLSVDARNHSIDSSKYQEEESRRFEYFKGEEEKGLIRNADLRETISKRYRDIEASIRTEFEQRSSKLTKSYDDEGLGEVSELTKGIEGFNYCLQQANTLIENQGIIKRNRTIREFVISGKFKVWM